MNAVYLSAWEVGDDAVVRSAEDQARRQLLASCHAASLGGRALWCLYYPAILPHQGLAAGFRFKIHLLLYKSD